MKTKYITESGSEYIIDDVAKTWERRQGPLASRIRSDSGTYESIGISNQGIFMVCQPYDPDIPVPRIISSSRIISWESVE